MKIVFVGEEPSKVLSTEHIGKIEVVGKGIEVSLDQKKIPEADILINPPLDSLDLKKLPILKWVHVQSAGINRMPKELRDSDFRDGLGLHFSVGETD